jgi:hypothetical protein
LNHRISGDICTAEFALSPDISGEIRVFQAGTGPFEKAENPRFQSYSVVPGRRFTFDEFLLVLKVAFDIWMILPSVAIRILEFISFALYIRI